MKEARASCEDKPLARMFHRSAALAVSAEASVCQNQKKTASSRKLRSHVSHVDRPLGSPEGRPIPGLLAVPCAPGSVIAFRVGRTLQPTALPPLLLKSLPPLTSDPPLPPLPPQPLESSGLPPQPPPLAPPSFQASSSASSSPPASWELDFGKWKAAFHTKGKCQGEALKALRKTLLLA